MNITSTEAVAEAEELGEIMTSLLKRMRAHAFKTCPRGHENIDGFRDYGEAVAQHTLSIRSLEEAVMRQQKVGFYSGVGEEA